MPLSEKTIHEVDVQVMFKWAELIDGTFEESALSMYWEKIERASKRTENRVGMVSEEHLPLLAEVVEKIARQYEEIPPAEALAHAQQLVKMTWFRKCVFKG